MPPGPRAGSAPTMKDVASAAGVSKALVSIVFRGAPGASDETRQRVFEAADRIGYRTNRTASLLARTRTRQLGVVPDLRNSFHADIVDAALQAADEAGYQLVFSPKTLRHEESNAIGTALEFRCEALLLLGSELSERELAELASELPVVLLGRDLVLPGVDVVRSDEQHGMEQVVDHLVGLGHRRIAHVDGGPGHIGMARRMGFEQGMRRHRILGRSIVLPGGDTEAHGRRAATALVQRAGLRPGVVEPPAGLDGASELARSAGLERAGLPSAVAAFNDHCALGVIDVLTRAGLRVPQDVSVTGYDDSPLAGLHAIDLTTVRQDASALADWAVRAAVERLDNGRAERRELVLKPELVVRGTSAAARRA